LSRAFRNYEGQNGLRQSDERFAKAAKLYQQNDFAAAAKLFAQVRASDTSGGETARKATEGELFCYRQLGHQAQDRKDYPAAQRWYEAALTVSPSDPQARAEWEAIRRVTQSHAAPLPTPLPPTASQVTTEHPKPTTPGASPLRASDFTNANARAAQEASAFLTQGDTAARRGDITKALRYWSKAVSAGPGSAAGQIAQRRVTEYNRQNNPLDFGN